MLEGKRISTFQTTILIIHTIIGVGILTLPRTSVEKVGPDAWLSIILGGLLSVLGAIFIIKLGLRFPQRTLVEYNPIILGKILGSIVSSVYILFWYLGTALVVRTFGEIMVIAQIPETPVQVIIMMMLIVVVYLVSQGIEGIARMSELVTPVFFIFMILILVIALKDADFGQLKPFLGSGMVVIAKTSLVTAWSYAGYEIMTILLPLINRPGDAMKATILGIVIPMMTYVAIVIVAIVTMGTDRITETFYPTLSLVKGIYIPVIERIEALFLAVWVISAFTTMNGFFYPSVLGLAQLLRLRNFKILVVPMGIGIYITSLIPKNIDEVYKYMDFLGITGLVLGIVVPLILLVVAVISKKGERGRVKS